MSNSSSITIKISPELKKAAQAKAERMDLTLSAVIKNSLNRFLTDQEVVFTELQPTDYLKELINRADKNHQHGDNYTFDDPQEALDFLKKRIK